MEINLKKLREEPIGKSKPAPVSSQAFYNFMKHEVRNGLRASLEFNGISGFKYIELDYKAKMEKRTLIKTSRSLLSVMENISFSFHPNLPC